MRICCVLASDANFLYQLRPAIATIRSARTTLIGVDLDVAVVGIDLAEEQAEALRADGLIVYENVDEFPLFKGAPRHAYALTCRPFIPEFLPGYDGYMWVDSDIRFVRPKGLQYYAAKLGVVGASVVIAHETEPCYIAVHDPYVARGYHVAFFERLRAVHGEVVADFFRYYNQHNAGLFAARADSPLWARYQRNLHKAMQVAYDRILEQDAMNVSIFEVGDHICAPCSMNWLCSQALPVKGPDGNWWHPEHSDRPIHVAHLTESSVAVDGMPGAATYYDVYQRVGLTV